MLIFKKIFEAITLILSRYHVSKQIKLTKHLIFQNSFYRKKTFSVNFIIQRNIFIFSDNKCNNFI